MHREAWRTRAQGQCTGAHERTTMWRRSSPGPTPCTHARQWCGETWMGRPWCRRCPPPRGCLEGHPHSTRCLWGVTRPRRPHSRQDDALPPSPSAPRADDTHCIPTRTRPRAGARGRPPRGLEQWVPNLHSQGWTQERSSRLCTPNSASDLGHVTATVSASVSLTIQQIKANHLPTLPEPLPLASSVDLCLLPDHAHPLLPAGPRPASPTPPARHSPAARHGLSFSIFLHSVSEKPGSTEVLVTNCCCSKSLIPACPVSGRSPLGPAHGQHQHPVSAVGQAPRTRLMPCEDGAGEQEPGYKEGWACRPPTHSSRDPKQQTRSSRRRACGRTQDSAMAEPRGSGD